MSKQAKWGINQQSRTQVLLEGELCIAPSQASGCCGLGLVESAPTLDCGYNSPPIPPKTPFTGQSWRLHCDSYGHKNELCAVYVS